MKGGELDKEFCTPLINECKKSISNNLSAINNDQRAILDFDFILEQNTSLKTPEK